MMKAFSIRNKNFAALSFIFLLTFIFYWDLFLAKSASLMGDHLEQHYPWAYLLSNSIKNFEIPWWTSFIHSGFPIVAEGQIAVFYPINLLLTFFLPIKWAYSYQNVVHFLIVGWGTYVYLRQLKLDEFSACISSIVFLFGAAYGGAYYNITSLKTIAWFPWCLYFLEKLWQTKSISHLALLSVAFSFSLLAGYLQVAVLMIGMVLIYGILRVLVPLNTKIETSRWFSVIYLIGAVFLSGLICSPQLFLTFELSQFSNRIGLTEDYAYVGSMSPVAFMTITFGELQGILRGNSLYGGIVTVFFILCAVSVKSTRQDPVFKLWFWMAVFSSLFALGFWSPLYVAIIKLTRFYSFRIPAKFLVFICFSIAVIAGLGFRNLSHALNKQTPAFLKKAFLGFVIVLASTTFFHGLFYFLVTAGRQFSTSLGEQFVRWRIYGKAGHPHSFDVYTEKLESSFNSMKEVLSFSNQWIIWMYIGFAVSLFLVVMFLKFEKHRKFWLGAMVIFLCADLYLFSWRDIRKDFNSYFNIEKPNEIVSLLVKEREEHRLTRLYGFRNQKEALPIIPSQNILYGIEDIGGYSPFVLQRYFETIGQFGNINDSNLAFDPLPDFVTERLSLISFLDISHILSTKRINHSALKELYSDGSYFLYLNQKYHTRAYFITQIEVLNEWQELKTKLLDANFNPQEMVLIEKSEIRGENFNIPQDSKVNFIKSITRSSLVEEYEIATSGPGFFVVSNLHYPGWGVMINGRETKLFKVYGLFQGVWIDSPGFYRIQFKYHPFKR